ncbi:ROK family protein [Bacillus infantis]|uniref:ROK family protein n=1 Tax=Bacillus infantis TaxID=324767 RepID=UPI003CFB33DB
MDGYVIGVDIGATNIRVGLIGKELSAIRMETAVTRSFNNADEMFGEIFRMAERVDPQKKAKKIGIALPVPWNDQTKIIKDADNIPVLDGIRIEYIQSCFPGLEVSFDNDVNAAGLLEAEKGAAAGKSYSLYMTVSTGIGMGVYYKGQMIRGDNGYAGEAGRMIIGQASEEEGTKEMTLESLCSGRALDARSKLIYGESADAEYLFKKFKDKEKMAVKVIYDWIEHFSSAVASIIQLMDPGAFVLGGAVICRNPWLIDEINHKIKGKLYANLRGKIKLGICAFGGEAGVIGAGYMALNQAKKQ